MAPSGFQEACEQVLGARTADDLFGPALPDSLRERKRSYRKLARLVHPDGAPSDQVKLAEQAFNRLVLLWEGTSQLDDNVMSSKSTTYTLGGLAGRDELSNTYACTWGDPSTSGLLRIPREARDSDLLAREERALGLLAQGDEKYRAYVPRLVEAFDHRDAKGAIRKCVVTELPEGLVSLKDVMEAYPSGLDPRDVAWMWRRLLVAAGFARSVGVTHGGIVPESVLIHPAHHGLVLTSWHASAVKGEKVPVVAADRQGLYPPEVFAKETVTSATDIHMLSGVVRDLMGEGVPRHMRLFLEACTLPSMSQRPQDPWALLAELDELLFNLWGPRKFRPFVMPTPGTGH